MSTQQIASTIANMTQRDIFEAQELSRKEVKAIKEEAKTMTATEARFLVDAYYIAQRERIRLDNQVRSMSADGEPNLVLSFLSTQAAHREDIMKKALDSFTKFHPVGIWMRSINGIGPVTAAALLAHIDINRAATAGAIWSFAGIDGNAKWEKGQKRPWNAALKTVAYKIGESFVKVSGNPDAYYGQLYKRRKELETARNLNGEYKEQAAAELASKNYTKGTVTRNALEAGQLSAAHIHARARRYAVKIFLSHLHEVMYKTILGKNPPAPFAIAILNHAHRLEVPNPDMIQDFVEPVEIIEDHDVNPDLERE
jgi:hypothetical protein